MLRAMWTGSISFGLVSIPVKAVPAQSTRDVTFELLHEPCGTRVQTRRYCPTCQRDAPSEELVRGYQFRKGQYVRFDQEELDAIVPATHHTLRILDFVDLAEIDPVYYEKPYYLRPAPGGERTYALLHRAMEAKGRVGVGKVAFRNREHLAVIRPYEHALVLETIAFPDEVRAVEEAVEPQDLHVDERELQMADMLIESMSGDFDPARYRDEYRDVLAKRIEEKVHGDGAAHAPAPTPRAKGEVVDLMEMLRKSVAAEQGVRAGAEDAPESSAAGKKQRNADEQEAPAEKRERTPAGAKSEKVVRPRRRRREKQAA